MNLTPIPVRPRLRLEGEGGSFTQSLLCARELAKGFAHNTGPRELASHICMGTEAPDGALGAKRTSVHLPSFRPPRDE